MVNVCKPSGIKLNCFFQDRIRSGQDVKLLLAKHDNVKDSSKTWLIKTREHSASVILLKLSNREIDSVEVEGIIDQQKAQGIAI